MTVMTDGACTTLEQVAEDLEKLAVAFDAGRLDGRQAARVVCAVADIERFALVLKTLAMRRVDETGAWRNNGSRSPQKWLAHKTKTSLPDAFGTVELGGQLEQLPELTDAARRGARSPVQTKMIASAASKDPASESLLLGIAQHGNVGTLKKECAAATQRGLGRDAMARIHERRSFRDWIAPDGAYRFEGTMTPDNGAHFKHTIEAFADQIFQDARRAGAREGHEQYCADGLMAMARAALAGEAAGASAEVPRFTRSKVLPILLIDASAWVRGYTIPGETCEVAGLGPIDVATARRMVGDALLNIVVTEGVDVRALAHAKHDVTRDQYLALVAEGYECNVHGCGNTRNLEIDHLGDGWAVTGVTVNGELALKCKPCHSLKTYKGWTDGPLLPDGKRKLIPPSTPPPDDT